MSARFTVDGSEALEQHLARVCLRVRGGVEELVPQDRLEGIVLAGGYGRGEGGVLRTGNGDGPYNDLEFFVFIRGSTVLNDHRYKSRLHHLGEDLSAEAGIEVEFKILSLAKFRSSGTSMFYYDLIMGHRWLVGHEALFSGCDHHRDALRIPLHEATRLLFNRCSGLLYARERLQRTVFTNEDADFVGRNIAKARLALGDVWLTMHGSYHWSCVERQRRLREAREGMAGDLVSAHAAGVAFKLHPVLASASKKHELASEHNAIGTLAQRLWLELEGKRMKHVFASSGDYAHASQSLCPEHPGWWNALCNFRAFGWRSLASPFLTRYPRERLLRALALLLWGRPDEAKGPTVSACLQCGGSGFAGCVQAYETLWHRFN